MIEVKNFTKTYNASSRTANTVLNDASVVLPDTGFVFIIGKSGIGKSTLLNAIGGLISYKGTILYEGKEVDIEKYRGSHIGYIFQDFLLLDDLSVRDNIKIELNLNGVYSETEITRRVSILLKAVGLNINPKRSASALSLGQRQRVAIARALAASPNVILADEPTGNLDSTNSVLIMNILKELSKTKLVICVTHNTHLLKDYADAAYEMIDKKIVKTDPLAPRFAESKDEQAIDVSSLKEQDIETKDILIKVYSDSNADEKTTLTIVKKNGKLMIAGDEIKVISKEEIIASNSKTVEASDIKSSSMEGIAFEKRDEKPSFKDSAVFQSFSRRFASNKINKKSLPRLLTRIMEALIPLAIFGLLDGLSGIYQEANISGAEISPLGNTQMVIASDEVDTGKMTQTDIINYIKESDQSGIIDAPNFNYAYSSSKDFLSCYSDLSGDLFRVALSNCSVTEDASKTVANKMLFMLSDYEAYQNLDSCKELKDYQLNDGEILLDKSLLTSDLTMNNGSLGDYQYFAGSLEDILPGTTISITKTTLTSYQVTKSYTIKGLVDTGFATAYGTKDDADSFRLITAMQVGTYANGSIKNLPSLDDTLFISYQEASASSDYEITQDPDIGYDDLINLGGLKEKPVSYLSDSLKAEYSFTADNVDKTIFNFDYFITPKAGKITYLKDPSKKVFCYCDFNYSGTSWSSGKEYLQAYLNSSAVYNSKTFSDSITLERGRKPNSLNEIVIPSCFLNHFSSLDDVNSFNQKYSRYNTRDLLFHLDDALTETSSVVPFTVVGTYQSDSLSDPIYLAEDGYLACNTYYRSLSSFDFNIFTSSSLSPKASAFSLSPIFVSSSPELTKKYFKDRNSDTHLVAYTLNEARQAYINETYLPSMMNLVWAVISLSLLAVLIMVLDNISQVNKDKNYYGILRAIGVSKKKLSLDSCASIIVDFICYCLIPTLIAMVILFLFNLQYLGWFYPLFLIGYLLISVISSELPLLISLRGKPMRILKSLN